MRKWANPEIICGVYEIKNTETDMVYIGASEDVYKRMYDHRKLLENNSHPNKNLQADWNNFGKDSFSFKLIEKCSEKALDNLEILNIRKAKDNGKCYNVLMGGRKTGWLGLKLSSETKDKLSRANIGDKNPMFGKTGNKNHFFGKKHSDKTRKTMSKNHLNVEGQNNPRFGKKLIGASSKYIGITFVNRFNRWLARITINGKRIYIGKFEKELDAVLAYNEYIEDNNLDNPKNIIT